MNELEGLSQQPCMQADLHMSNQLSRQLFFFCNSSQKIQIQIQIHVQQRQKTVFSPQATLLQQSVCTRFWARPGQHQHPARQVRKKPLATGSSWQSGNLTSGKLTSRNLTSRKLTSRNLTSKKQSSQNFSSTTRAGTTGSQVMAKFGRNVAFRQF